MKPSFEPVRIVVTDAGPLIALAKSGYLHLLPALFGEILMPYALKFCAWLANKTSSASKPPSGSKNHQLEQGFSRSGTGK